MAVAVYAESQSADHAQPVHALGEPRHEFAAHPLPIRRASPGADH